MTRYERAQVPADEDFEIDGEIVEVLSRGTNTLEVLVAVPSEGPLPSTFEDDPERVDLYAAGSDEPVDSLPKSTFFCNVEKDSGDGSCRREVDEPGETCWQHSEDGDDE